LRIMGGKAQLSMLNEDTLFDRLGMLCDKTCIDSFLNNIVSSMGLYRTPYTWSIFIMMFILTIVIKLLTDYFLKTEVGLALRATGDNQKMISSFSTNTDYLIIIGLGISNGFVALSGGLIAQQGGFADAGMGIGMIVIAVASVMMEEASVGTKAITRTTLEDITSEIIYRNIVTSAIKADFLETGDMKLISALLVIVALVVPKIVQTSREKKRRRRKRAMLEEVQTEGVQ